MQLKTFKAWEIRKWFAIKMERNEWKKWAPEVGVVGSISWQVIQKRRMSIE
jgi:hypothetical protein